MPGSTGSRLPSMLPIEANRQIALIDPDRHSLLPSGRPYFSRISSVVPGTGSGAGLGPGLMMRQSSLAGGQRGTAGCARTALHANITQQQVMVILNTSTSLV